MPTRYEWDGAWSQSSSFDDTSDRDAQTFTPQANHTVKLVKLKQNADGASTVEIFATTGGEPSGAALASGTLRATKRQPYVMVSLGTGASLTSGNLYAIVITAPSSLGINTSNPYSGGKIIDEYLGVWYLNSYNTWDMLFEEWDDTFPYPPFYSLPIDNATGVSITPTLSATYEHCAAITQNAAQWQVSTVTDFSSTVWDSGTDTVNLLNVVVPVSLDYNTTYYWRVKHRDANNNWSDWGIHNNWDTYTSFHTFTTMSTAPPAVTTNLTTAISGTSATGNAEITGLGTPTATQYGHCWNTTGTPTTADNKVENGIPASTGQYVSLVTGLTAGTLYYIRAYITGSAVVYGAQDAFIAGLPRGSIGVVGTEYHYIGYDGREYALQGTLVL